MDKYQIFERCFSSEQASERWYECLASIGVMYRVDSPNKIELSPLTHVCFIKNSLLNTSETLGIGKGKSNIESILSAQYEALEHYLSYHHDTCLADSNLFFHFLMFF